MKLIGAFEGEPALFAVGFGGGDRPVQRFGFGDGLACGEVDQQQPVRARQLRLGFLDGEQCRAGRQKAQRTELALRQRDSRRELFVEEVETDQAAGVGAVRRADPFPQQQETFVGTLDRVEQRGAAGYTGSVVRRRPAVDPAADGEPARRRAARRVDRVVFTGGFDHQKVAGGLHPGPFDGLVGPDRRKFRRQNGPGRQEGGCPGKKAQRHEKPPLALSFR